MNETLLLSKIFGLYFLAISLLFFTRKHVLQEAIDNFCRNFGLIFFSGLIVLLMGLLIVLTHNIWEMSWRVSITILGYLILLKGLLRIYFPTFGRDIAFKIVYSGYRYYFGLVLVLLGVFFTVKGFGW